MKIIVRPQAVEDVVRAAAWYERQQTGVGEALIDEIVRAIDRAAANGAQHDPRWHQRL